MKISIFFAICIFLTTSCNNPSQKEKELKEIINEPLTIDIFQTVNQSNRELLFEELIQNHKYLSVVYLQNGCNPCYPKFIEWQNKMDTINTPDDYTVLFVIKGESYGDFMTKVLDIEYVDDKFYTIMDTEGKFLKYNKDIPRWIIDSSVLIDGENKIKMVGAPFSTPEMTELFHEICAK